MRAFICVAVLVVGTGAVAKECRMPDLPSGVQVQLPPGCKDAVRVRKTEAQRQDSLRTNQGFIDFGNGTQVRISGRVRAEFGVRR